jgi:hypothetical protein
VLLVTPATLLAADSLAIAGAIAVVIGALGIGSIAAAAITASKDRDLYLREKMLGAADDFIRASTGALDQLRKLDPTRPEFSLSALQTFVLGEVSHPALASSELDSVVVKEVQGFIDEAGHQLTRVVLLFSPMSKAATEAERATMSLRESWKAMRVFYVLSHASTSDDAQQRQKMIERGLKDIGDLGVTAGLAIPAVGVLGALIGGASQWLVKWAGNVNEPLEKVRPIVAQGLADAQKALTNFASSAGSQALEPKAYKKVRKVYTVNEREQIVVSLEPRRGLGRVRALF